MNRLGGGPANDVIVLIPRPEIFRRLSLIYAGNRTGRDSLFSLFHFTDYLLISSLVGFIVLFPLADLSDSELVADKQ